MRRTVAISVSALFLIFFQTSFAGNLFNVFATGMPGNVNITLCLNGKGPLSCQDYNVSALDLTISTTILNHTYPFAEIKLNTPGYTLANAGLYCIDNDYCFFSVSNSTYKTISIQNTSTITLTISPSSLPDATPNIAYDQTVAASGGVAPYTYAITSGSLPPGLSLNTSTGILSGTPTSNGTYNFTVTATDANADTGFQTYSLNVVPPPLTTAGAYNTCSGCDYIPLAAVSTDGGINWVLPSIFSDINPGYLNTTACTGSGSTAVCLAGGQAGFNPSTQAILAVSTDGGTTWAYDSITNNPTTGTLLSSSCTGSGPSAICVAVGQDQVQNLPLIVTSTDGGTTWAVNNTPPYVLGGGGSFYTASCTGNGARAVCMAAGQTGAYLSGPPILAVSTDGANNWSIVNVPNIPTDAFLEGSSCSNTICIAVGETQLDQNGPPLLVASTDGGNTWGIVTIPSTPSSGNFLGASCTGSGSTAICVAAGEAQPGANGPPLLAVSTTGGSTWAYNTSIPTLIPDGVFYSVSCTGSASNAVCVAAGQVQPDVNGPPLLVASVDGGNTWQIKTVTDAPTDGIFYSVSCTGSGSAAICVAAGEAQPDTYGLPFLAVSIDGGTTWEVNTTAQPTEGGYYFSAGSANGTTSN